MSKIVVVDCSAQERIVAEEAKYSAAVADSYRQALTVVEDDTANDDAKKTAIHTHNQLCVDKAESLRQLKDTIRAAAVVTREMTDEEQAAHDARQKISVREAALFRARDEQAEADRRTMQAGPASVGWADAVSRLLGR